MRWSEKLPPATNATSIEILGWIGLRLLLLLLAQGAVVVGLMFAGQPEPLWASVSWWPLSVSGAQIIFFLLLQQRWGGAAALVRQLSRGTSPTGRMKALLSAAGLLSAWVPAWWVAQFLWGDAAAGRLLLLSATPAGATLLAWSLLPLSTVLVELPLLAWWVRRIPNGALAVAAGALLFTAAHALHPFAPAMQFFIWRSLMPLALGLFYAATLRRWPALLGTWMALHALVVLASVAWIYQ
jgi:hypothetical protein